MEFPVRCFSCGAPLAQMYENYLSLLASKKTPEQALNEMGVKRVCCRRMFIAHVPMDKIAKYKRM